MVLQHFNQMILNLFNILPHAITYLTIEIIDVLSRNLLPHALTYLSREITGILNGEA
jgi:hypothetical protein